MEMMKCPHCGAQNSSKREYCFQCEGSLQGQATSDAADSGPTCARCSCASVFPPVGQRLTPDQVWCTKEEDAVPSTRIGGDCFSEPFRWQREEILD